MWLMILPLEHCPTAGVFIVAKLKQKQTKSNPNDSHLGTLSVGQNVVMILPWEHCPTGGVFIVAKLKKKYKLNLILMTPILELFQ